MNNNIKFIAIEGLDGSGKTSSISFLENYFKDKGYFVHRTSAIGSGDGGWFLRQALLSGNISNQDVTNLLTVACHKASITEINKLRKQYENENINVVILHDRYLASYWAYNYLNPMISDSEDIKNKSLMLFNSFLNINDKELQPDLYLYIDVDPVIAKDRIDKRNEKKEYADLKPIEYFEKLKESFDDYFETNLVKRVTIDNNTNDIEVLFNQLRLSINRYL